MNNKRLGSALCSVSFIFSSSIHFLNTQFTSCSFSPRKKAETGGGIHLSVDKGTRTKDPLNNNDERERLKPYSAVESTVLVNNDS